MLKEVKSFKVLCDHCKKSLEDSDTDYGVYCSKGNAECGVITCGWTAVHIETDRTLTYHFCPKCATAFHEVIDKFTGAVNLIKEK